MPPMFNITHESRGEHMLRNIIILAITMLVTITILVGSTPAQNTGGDKARQHTALSKTHKASNTAQPPDPLVSHKSPGRNKRSHHHAQSDALTVKQKQTPNSRKQ